MTDQTEPEPRSMIDPSDTCQDVRCSRIDGRCVGYHCAVCGNPCSMLGHESCRAQAGDVPTVCVPPAVSEAQPLTNRTSLAEPAGAEVVIDFAARVVHEVVSKELGTTPDTVPHPTDVVAVRELARRGLLVPVELWDDRAREATPLLRHAAALAARSGKKRTAEWLTACATLPPAEWPPAPAYKGPVVPAAEHQELRAELEEWRSQVDHAKAGWVLSRIREALGTPDGRAVSVHAAEVRAERDQLKARLDAAKLTWAAAAAIADVGAAENPARWETAQAAIVDFGKALNGDQPAELKPDGRCPNSPPCEHPAMIHDVSGDPEDPRPMCCTDGCTCGQPDARTVRSGPTPQGIPAESRSTMDSGGVPECICAGGRCDYDDHDNPLTGDECDACAQLTDTSTCPAYEGDYVPSPPEEVPGA